MVKKALFSGISIHRGQFFLIFFLIFNSITWFFTVSTIAQKHVEEVLNARQLFLPLPIATILSLLIGPLIAEKVSRRRFLLFWVLMGVISPLFSMVLPKFGEYGVATLLVLWGFSFGIGFPSCLALMAASTRTENRGLIGGAIFFPTYILMPLIMLSIGGLDIELGSLLLAAWRGLCLPLFLLRVDKIDADITFKSIPYSSILASREFLFYFVPWLIFCLINQLELFIIWQSYGVDVWRILLIFESVVGAFICFVAGWLMDVRGRKWTILIGFVTLGLAYAVLSFFGFEISGARAFFVAADGIAWGIFTVAFGLIVWGDMASHQRAEKFYGLGSAPSALAIALSTLLLPWLGTLDATKTFPMASFFLFLAVIPIFFAPELLPEKVVKERELKKYMEEAKKIAGRE
jgi:hypothetical protein